MSWQIWSWTTLYRAASKSRNAPNAGFRTKRKVLPVAKRFLDTNAIHEDQPDSRIMSHGLCKAWWLCKCGPESQAQLVQGRFSSACLLFHVPSQLGLSSPTLSLRLGTLLNSSFCLISLQPPLKCLSNPSPSHPQRHGPSSSFIGPQWDYCM